MEINVMLFVFTVASVGIVSARSMAKFYPAPTKEVSSTYVVVLRKGLSQASDTASLSVRLSKTYGIQSTKQIHIGNFRALIIKTDRERVTSLLNEPKIDYIEQDKPVKAVDYNTSSCPEYAIDELGQWGLIRIESREAIDLDCGTGTQFPCNYRDNNTYSYSDLDNGVGTYVYVFDTGIYVDHKEFGGRAEYGFVASSIYEPPGDLYGHGTHVAGIAVGEKYGVAKAARAVSVKVLDGEGSGKFSGVVEGVEWVVNDIKTKERKGVCNLSLGGPGYFYAMEDAIRSAMSEGIPFVIAAGNEAQDACLNQPSFLGKDSAAITVGATTALDSLAGFSNFGDCVNILAPGHFITSAAISNSPIYNAPNSGYVELDGTSMASPFVAGVVARLISREQSSLTPWGIKLWLLQTATVDAISMGTTPQIMDTPNKLLHFSCGLPYVELTTLSTTSPSSTPLVESACNTGMAGSFISLVAMVIITLQI